MTTQNNRRTIAAIIVAVMAIPIALFVGSIAVPAARLFELRSLISMGVNAIGFFALARALWVNKKYWAALGGLGLLVGSFALASYTSAGFNPPSLIVAIQAIVGLALIYRYNPVPNANQ